jgi:hypothetical protein
MDGLWASAGALGGAAVDACAVRPLLTALVLLTALCVRYGSYTMLHVPLLLFVSASVAVDLVAYGLVRGAVTLVEWVWVVGYKRRDRQMRRSTYDEWLHVGAELDRLERLDEWKADAESRAYNWRQVQAVTKRLREARQRAESASSPGLARVAYTELESMLLPTLVKNYAGTMSAELCTRPPSLPLSLPLALSLALSHTLPHARMG